MSANTIGCSLLGHSTAQPEHSVLRSHVWRLEHRGELRMNGTDIENAAAPARLVHMPQAGSRSQKSSIKVHREYLLPVAIRQVVNTSNDLDPCIAAEDIDAAKLSNGS